MTTGNIKTPYTNICAILAELWLDYKTDAEFVDFIEYNDLGLPLAFAIHEGIVEDTLMSAAYIQETWDLFITSLEATDTGFENLNDVIASVGPKEI